MKWPLFCAPLLRGLRNSEGQRWTASAVVPPHLHFTPKPGLQPPPMPPGERVVRPVVGSSWDQVRDIGVYGGKAAVEGGESALVGSRQLGEVCIGHLSVSDNASHRDVGE